MSLLMTGLLAQSRIDARQDAFRAALGDASLGFQDLARITAAYCGPLPPDIAASLSARWHDARPDLFSSADHARQVLGDGGLGTVAGLADAALPAAFMTPADEGIFARNEILPARGNAHRSDELPASLSRSLHEAECPALDVFSANDVSLFCSPEGFQVFREAERVYARSGASRPLSTAVLDVAHITVERPVVLVQDVFHGSNFAHFLFDWVIRVMAFAAAQPADPRACLFVMGGFPGEFHALVLRALRAELGLDEDNFFFPEDQVVLRSRSTTFWFSDTTNPSGHPAQKFQPVATTWIRELARAILPQPPARTRRLYISRADAGRRMVANEAALLPLLERHGFETVLLGNIPVADQIALMASATHVVAAHGMGLTHLAFNPGAPTLVELFNPRNGTDTYAFMAKALGFAYAPLIGQPLEDDAQNFTIDLSQVEPHLPSAAGPPPTPELRRRWLAEQSWAGGTQAIAAAPDPTAPPREGSAVLRHVRDGVSEDSNVGWWELRGLAPDALYAARCGIFIPTDSGVTEATWHFYGATTAEAAVDLSQRGSWQFLAVAGMGEPASATTASAHLVLRMNGSSGSFVLTCGWTVTGPWPTSADTWTIATLALESVAERQSLLPSLWQPRAAEAVDV